MIPIDPIDNDFHSLSIVSPILAGDDDISKRIMTKALPIRRYLTNAFSASTSVDNTRLEGRLTYADDLLKIPKTDDIEYLSDSLK